jgi:lysyl-tRNA synthetase class I
MKSNDYTNVVCECGRVDNLFLSERIINVWQKNGFNHYEFKCECGKTKIVSITIED